MKVETTDAGVVLDFETPQRPRVRLFFLLEAAATAVMALAYLLALSQDAGLVVWGMILLFSGVYLVYAYRFAARATTREKLILTPTQLRLERRNLFGKRVRTFDVRRISHWSYRGTAPGVPHPLATQSFDYLGFETNRKIIDQVHDDGNFSFDYDGVPVHFGRNIYSWQAEEVAAWMRTVLPNDLTIADADEAFLKEYGLDSGAMP